MTPEQRDAKRYKDATLKTLEAKANLWFIASFAATIGVLAGIVVAIAAFFKFVLG